MEPSSVFSSHRKTSHLLLLQPGNDLTDSAGYRLMTTVMTSSERLSAIKSSTHSLISPTTTPINKHNIYGERDLDVFLFVDVVVRRKHNQKEKIHKRDKKEGNLFKIWPPDRDGQASMFVNTSGKWQANTEGCLPALHWKFTPRVFSEPIGNVPHLCRVIDTALNTY